jgi:hypothetical protein
MTVLALPLEGMPEPGPSLRGRVEQVFTTWQKATGRRRAVLLPVRRRLIERRLLDGYSVEDLCAAVRGWQWDEWCSGINPQGQQYNDLEFVLRVSERCNNVERFADLWHASASLRGEEDSQ